MRWTLTVFVERSRLEAEKPAPCGVALAVVLFRADLVELDLAKLLLGLGFQAVELLLGLGAGGVDLMGDEAVELRGCVGIKGQRDVEAALFVGVLFRAVVHVDEAGEQGLALGGGVDGTLLLFRGRCHVSVLL